jgi:hypothetical protein
MKTHSTNYINTFITVAEDTTKAEGTPPPQRSDKKSIATLQYELLSQNPYKYTSDDLFFKVFSIRQDLTESELEAERHKFFSKGQPCFRASPLTKQYGWGVHSDKNCKIALFGMETEKYQDFIENSDLKKVSAMRSARRRLQ